MSAAPPVVRNSEEWLGHCTPPGAMIERRSRPLCSRLRGSYNGGGMTHRFGSGARRFDISSREESR